MDAKECPLCGTRMRLNTREHTDRVPGSREQKVSRVREWVCPECDYFEDVEEESESGAPRLARANRQ